MSAAKRAPERRAAKGAGKVAGKTAGRGASKAAAKAAPGPDRGAPSRTVAKAAKRAAKRAPPRTAPVKRASGPTEPVVFTGRGGARVWGGKHPAAQLTERQVIRFRRLVRDRKATVGELAAEVGCGHSRISMAVRGETWAHLNEVAPPVG